MGMTGLNNISWQSESSCWYFSRPANRLADTVLKIQLEQIWIMKQGQDIHTLKSGAYNSNT